MAHGCTSKEVNVIIAGTGMWPFMGPEHALPAPPLQMVCVPHETAAPPSPIEVYAPTFSLLGL